MERHAWCARRAVTFRGGLERGSLKPSASAARGGIQGLSQLPNTPCPARATTLGKPTPLSIY